MYNFNVIVIFPCKYVCPIVYPLVVVEVLKQNRTAGKKNVALC